MDIDDQLPSLKECGPFTRRHVKTVVFLSLSAPHLHHLRIMCCQISGVLLLSVQPHLQNPGADPEGVVLEGSDFGSIC